MALVCRCGHSRSDSWKKSQTPAGPSSERAVSSGPQVKVTVQALRSSASSQSPAWQVAANSRSSEWVLSQYSGCAVNCSLAAAFRKYPVTSSYVNNALLLDEWPFLGKTCWLLLMMACIYISEVASLCQYDEIES